MVLADGVAVASGAVLHKRLPEHFLHGMASVLFLLFGLCCSSTAGLASGGSRWESAVAVATAAAAAFVRGRREHPQALRPLESSPDPGRPPAGYCPSND